MANQQDMMQQLLGKTVANAWGDPDFKARLINDPRSVLHDIGLMPPPHLELRVVENTAHKVHITLPAPWADMSDPAFIQRMQQDSKSVLAEAGINIPDNAEIIFLENTDNRMHIVLPVAPSHEEISIQKI